MGVFRIGDPVEIQVKLGTNSISLYGKLAQVVRPLLEIHLNQQQGHIGAVQPGTSVVVYISGGTGIYIADAIVQRCYAQTGQVVVSIDGCFRFQQRRQHERYRCEMQARLRVVGDNEWVPGICRDISAGGARIYLSREFVLRSNTMEVVFISPTNHQAVHTMAEVVRTSKLVGDNGWEIGIRFAEMNRMEKIQFARLLQYWESVAQHDPVDP